MNFMGMLSQAGNYIANNPQIIPMALQAYGTYRAVNAPSLDPGAGARAFQRGLSGIGNTYIAGHQLQQRKAAEEAARKIRERQLELLEQKNTRDIAQRSAYEQAVQGLFPSTPYQGPLVGDEMPEDVSAMRTQDPRGQLLASLGPQAGGSIVGRMMTQQPKTLQDAAGYQRFATGPQAGQRVFPDVKREPRPGEIGSVSEFRTPEGGTVNAFFDKRARNWIYRDQEGREQVLPPGSRKITPTSTGQEKMRPGELLKLRTAMSETEGGLKQVTRYMESVKETGKGLDLLADRWLGKLKTIFNGVPTADQLSVLEQQGRLQGMLGRFREEVVGGGVMTEYDAQRVIAALGGEPDATRHPEIVRRLLSEIVSQKIEQYNSTLLPMFNDQADRSGVYKPRKALTMPDVFQAYPNAPPVGTIKSGYRFKGGDPAAPASWEAVQ